MSVSSPSPSTLPSPTKHRPRNDVLAAFLAIVGVAVLLVVPLWRQAVRSVVPRPTLSTQGHGDVLPQRITAEQHSLKTPVREPSTVSDPSPDSRRPFSPFLYRIEDDTVDGVQADSAHDSDHVNTTSYSHTRATTDGSLVEVRPDDYIYRRHDWASAPFVIERYKLIFFTIPKVACTVWKQLFRRINGAPDWNRQTDDMRNHNPKLNGLTYLWDYSIANATAMMNSPEWTRAVFLRNPQQRLVSAFMDKALTHNGRYIREKCCAPLSTDHAGVTPEDRERLQLHSMDKCVRCAQHLPCFLDLVEVCDNPHWRPQSQRMEPRYWKTINFVGFMSTVQRDARTLLAQIGAWDDYGSTGWGERGNLVIFERNTVSHGTNSTAKAHLVMPKLKLRIENYYRDDYEYLGVFERSNVSLTVRSRNYSWRHRSVHRYRRVLNSKSLAELAG